MLVVGTGAVASFLLPKLALVTPHLQVYGRSSRRLSALHRFQACASAERLESHQEWLIVCKVGQNPEKIRQLRSAPAPLRILVLQNGLAPEAEWQAAWPKAKVERGLNTYGVRSVSPGQAEGGEQGEIVLARSSPWQSLLLGAGLHVRPAKDMRAEVWKKLIINASLNVVATIGNLRNGEVLEQPLARAFASRAAEEVAALACSLRVPLQRVEAAKLMEGVAQATSANICSTLADFRAGRVSEYDAINGEILRLACRQGLRLPALEELDRQFALMLSMRPALERLAS